MQTIAALATPPGKGGVAIIRLSGESAHDIAAALCPLPEKPQFRHMYYLPLTHQNTRIDHALVVLFGAGESYTGEPVTEFHCHGGRAAGAALLQALYSLGAVPAGPGEFTRRAFYNGKLDLSQAESVAEVIGAESEAALRAAQELLAGSLGKAVKAAREEITEALAALEANLDFPDETDEAQQFALCHRHLQTALEHLAPLMGGQGRILREGLRVAIAGRPNAGKSTLLNALCGREAALVSPRAGTTRDVLHEEITLAGLSVHLYDTAGLRSRAAELERQGIQRALRKAEEADYILYLIDAAAGVTPYDRRLLKSFAGKMGAVVLNKTDLSPAPTENLSWPAVTVSLLEPEGAAPVRALLAEQAEAIVLEGGAVTLERHRAALQSAQESLLSAQGLPSNQADAASAELYSAFVTLGEITGETASEDIIDRIFARFCVGK